MPDQKALLLMDNFAAHSSGDVIRPLEDNGVLSSLLSFYHPKLQIAYNRWISA